MTARFDIAMHILTLLASAEGEYVQSDYIAGSMNINPVIVRKEISHLRNAGLVDTREGKNGGSALAKAAAKIRLSDVYEVVRGDSLLGRNKNKPNPDCAVGKQIGKHLEKLHADAEQMFVQGLKKTTLADFVKMFG
ncbi:MAG: Rrf2 family transcriptional regulator [Filimonas sp.]|nr:Rrf2 family transcriptional regulator [Filimonas sp.]